jgi:predicted metal-binding protein
MPWEAEKILKKYNWGILIRTQDPKLAQEISFQVEMKAFFDGYPLAFSMFDCYLCETCVFPDPCRFPEKARPSMQALSIDVYATVKKLGLPIEPLKTKGEKPNYYALVLIE